MNKLLNTYQIDWGSHRKRGYSETAIVSDEQTNRFFAKWFTGLIKSNSSTQVFAEKLRHLKRANHTSLPKIIQYGYDENISAFVIIYELLENVESLETKVRQLVPDVFFTGIQEVVHGLDELLTKYKITHGDIHPDNILVKNDGKFILIDFSEAELALTLSQESELNIFAAHFAAPEKLDNLLARGHKYQEDIYSIGKVLQWYFNHAQKPINEEFNSFIDRCTKRNFADRYLNYKNLSLDFLRSVEKFNLSMEANLVIGIYAGKIDWSLMKPLCEHLNTEKNIYAEVRTNDKADVLLNLITTEYLIHCLWIIEKMAFAVLDIKSKNEAKDNWEQTKRYGKRLPTGAMPFVESLSPNEQQYSFTPLLKSWQREKVQQKYYRDVKKKTESELGFFKELLNEEKMALRKKSLRLQYTRFEKTNADELWFSILENEKLSSGPSVSKHIDFGSDPRFEGLRYSVSTSLEVSNKKIKPTSFFGIAYDFDLQNRVLKFKDCENFRFEDIPIRGFITEDIGIQEAEINRQLDAIIKVEKREVQNFELIHYLFDPGQMPQAVYEEPILAKTYQRTEDDQPIEYFPNQTRAIVNAIKKKPLTLIQGPPGTGKTTVITEIIFQLLHQDPDLKILITSQTNDAVDKVLENLLEQNIEIVRLAGERKPGNEKIKKHTIDNKIEGWKKEVANKSNGSWKQYMHQKVNNNLQREEILLQTIIKILLGSEKWDKKKGALKQFNEKFNVFGDLSKIINDEDECIDFFASRCKKIDLKQFLQLQKIQSRWIGAISNLNEKSAINEKLIDSIGVIGATCNHVASRKYDKFNFEFDYVIMDESGKATTAEALVPIVFADNLVLVGDHRQLRPMLTKDKEIEKWIIEKGKADRLNEEDDFDDYLNRKSLFENVYTSISDDYKVQLTQNLRSAADQVRLTSECFYEPFGDEAIEPVPRSSAKEHNLNLKVNSSIVFLDIGNHHRSKRNDQGSQFNIASAKLIPEILHRLDGLPLLKGYKVGIITGYSGQLGRIKNELGDYRKKHFFKSINVSNDQLAVSVVDRFQGLEKDIIIFDLVRSGTGVSLGFLDNANRINVALSRQKRLIIIVGDYQSIITAKVPEKFIKKGEKVQLQEYLKKLNKNWIVNDINQIF